MKIVVFDLDETLGYFTEYGIFWDILNNYLKIHKNYELTQRDFNVILDLYPEFIRPNIINILNYLKNKKIAKCCHKMMIYTNNTGPKQWCQRITSYFDEKINYSLFDQIISAFKVNGKNVEICRTTHNKTHQDFIRCTKLPANAEICFLDDNFYPEMANDNIYYINIKPYFHDILFDDMINRFMGSDFAISLQLKYEDLKKYMNREFKRYNYHCVVKDETEYEIDVILGKQIMNHLQDFFLISSKNNITYFNKTQRNNNTTNNKNNNRNKSRKKR